MDHHPQPSRPSTSEGSYTVHGPVPLFDLQLSFLTDSYLTFFQERKRIEDIYVESLKKLCKKIKATDATLDDRTDLSTARAAWGEVLDNVERESQARQAFCAALVTDAINPLTALKETQERTRKRIKEDLKDSIAAYNEYAEGMLPKLKSRYTKKITEVEEQKKAANAAPTSPLPGTSPPSTMEYHHFNSSKSNPAIASHPTVTAPQPLRPLDRRPSGSIAATRNRSPSTSVTAFSDLALHGKKQLNQLIGFLDKGGSQVKDSLGGSENHALRGVRAKREADEADREYRKGVHWLETLRIRRTKILENGYKSLVMFIDESATVIKKVVEHYLDNMMATGTTQSQLANHARSVVDKISPEKDSSKVAMNIPWSIAAAIPEPILYENAQVGPCKDLIFGFSLVDYATSRGLREGEIPKIVRVCIAEIDKRGLDFEGIFRVSGRHAVVQALQHEIEKDETKFAFSQRDDIYAVASLLKLYLRELPEPVFKFPLQDRIQHTDDRADHVSNNFMLLRSKMRRLPPVHQAVLKALVELLLRVVNHKDKNKMDAKNLVIVFGSVIFGEDEIPKGGDALLTVQTAKDTVMEDLIMNANVLFDDQGGNYSPPLPPRPTGEPVPQYSYGSKMTKVTNVPATSFGGQHSRSSSQDFTPKLPPRPANSIHPSRATSPTRNRQGQDPILLRDASVPTEQPLLSPLVTFESNPFELESSSSGKTPTSGYDEIVIDLLKPIPSVPSTSSFVTAENTPRQSSDGGSSIKD